MVCYVKIHTCHRWLWTVSGIVPWFLTAMKNYCSSTAFKSSSSMTSSYKSSHVTLIIFVRCIILWSLIVLQLCIIVLCIPCTLLCIIILWWCSKLLCIVVLWLWLKLLRGIILWFLRIFILRLLRRLSCYMFILHPICI
jgi:hypothetical protein